MRGVRGRVLIALAVILAAGCGSGTTTTSSATTTTTVAGGSASTTAGSGRPVATTTPPTSPPTSTAYATTPVSVPGEGETALLAAVRTGAQNGFDRVTFEFANRLPGYTAGYVERPIVQDGSGNEVAVQGTAVLRIAMAPASGTDLSAGGRPSYTGPNRLAPGTPALAEIVHVGDFEGHLTWVIGVPTKAGFNVSTLASPPRLVIDIQAG